MQVAVEEATQIAVLSTARAASLLAFGAVCKEKGDHAHIVCQSKYAPGEFTISLGLLPGAKSVARRLDASRGPLEVFSAAHRLATEELLGVAVSRVVFLRAISDAAAFYRCAMPAYALNQGSTFRAFTEQQIIPKTLVDFDVVVFQIIHNEYARQLMRGLKQAGKKVVYEIDDAFWALEENQPGYLYYSRPSVQQEVIGALRIADMVTCPTGYLAQHLRKFTDVPVEIVQNCAPIRRDAKPVRERKRRRPFRALWFGSDSHAGDLGPLRGLGSWLKENGGEFVLLGHDPGFPNTKALLHVPFSEYQETLTRLAPDVVLAPLADNQFNKAKSAIRVHEATWFARAPVIASPVGPYAEFENGEEILHAEGNGLASWKRSIRVIMESPELGGRLWKAAVDRALQDYDIEGHTKRIQDIYAELLA